MVPWLMRAGAITPTPPLHAGGNRGETRHHNQEYHHN